MKRGRISANTVLKILRTVAQLKQQDLAAHLNTDQSTVSRIENGELWVTPETANRYVDACGGSYIIRLLIDRLQELLGRLQDNRLPLMPA